MSEVVILSGGMDSTVCMGLAARRGPAPPVALTFDYGQRHRRELQSAAAVASHYGAEQVVVRLDASRWGGSALTDLSLGLPPPGAPGGGIPATYVPARNLIFLAVALGVAEAREADGVWIGVNSVDYSGYPDCRPETIEAFRRVAEVGQRRGVEGRPVEVHAPLIERTKAEIVRIGLDIGAPFELTWSCYAGGPAPCGECDACALRAKGFAEAGEHDPA